MNPRPLVIAIVAGLAALCLAFCVSPWLGFAILAVCLLCVCVAGVMVKNAPVDPEWAEEPQWFNCATCDWSYSTDGRRVIFSPKICVPLGICPSCQKRDSQRFNQSLVDAIRNRPALTAEQHNAFPKGRFK